MKILTISNCEPCLRNTITHNESGYQEIKSSTQKKELIIIMLNKKIPIKKYMLKQKNLLRYLSLKKKTALPDGERSSLFNSDSNPTLESPS